MAKSIIATPSIKSFSDLAYVREKWGRFLLLGATMLIAGLIALVCTTTTTLVTVMFLGWFLLVAGIAQLIESFSVQSWSGFVVHLITGIFQTVVGVMILGAPAANAVLITFLFAIFLIVGGLFRIVAGFRLPVVGGLIALSGFASFILGVMIWRQWPDSSLWFIGFFVSLDLIMHGTAWIAFALRARDLPPAIDSELTPVAA
jgi:uncharacterized membrane protein HdeD (DUF308 family)